MNKLKIGLVLSGGGARGAYQIGVMLALKKYGLYNNVASIAGGSIGSFALFCYLIDDLKKSYQTFTDMNSERVLGYKKAVKNKIPVFGQGMFSRDPLITYINKNFNLAELAKTDMPLFVSAAKEDKSFIKSRYSSKYFRINNLPYEEILNILLASSAVPYIFDSVHIGKDNYVDCMKADSEPFTPLLDTDINCLFIVPLTDFHNVNRYVDIGFPIVDFESPDLRNSPIINMLSFEPDKVEAFLNCGYFTGVAIMSALYNSCGFKINKLPLYTSLTTLGITIIPHRLFTIDEIFEDVRKGAKK